MAEIRYELLQVDVLYNMVKTYHEKNLTDMFVALAHYISDSGRDGLYEVYHDYRKFWSAHYEEMIKAYPDYEAFKAAFEDAVKKEAADNE